MQSALGQVWVRSYHGIMKQNTDETAAANNKSSGIRLDELMVARGLAATKSHAQRLIMAGKVLAAGQVVDKAGKKVPVDVRLEVKAPLPYVSRGGLKLEAALDAFGVNPGGLVCADIGASTGGFTDCLLKRGATRVYAVDVGYGQLAWSLRTDPRVIAIERVNVRFLDKLPEPVGLAVVDVSFISLRLILPRVADLLIPAGQAIALIKPQFEVGKGAVGKGGVVRDPQLHRLAIMQVVAGASEAGFEPAGLIRSPITGPAGNIEFLVWLRLGSSTPGPIQVDRWLDHSLGLVLPAS
jgi:23S rRNA (cytidine1920-2'-O)/16S rRNA (cytidine1409-2'-O)-methyltransferase